MASGSSKNLEERQSSDDGSHDYDSAILYTMIMLVRQFNTEVLERQQAKAMLRVPTEKKFSVIYNLMDSEVHGKPRSKLLKTRKLQHIICAAHVRKEFRNVKPLKINSDAYLRRRNPRNVLEDIECKMTFLKKQKHIYRDVLREIYIHSQPSPNSNPALSTSRNLNILSPANRCIKKCIDSLISEKLIHYKYDLFKYSIWDGCRAGYERNLKLKILMMKAMENDDYNGDNGDDDSSLRGLHVVPFL